MNIDLNVLILVGISQFYYFGKMQCGPLALLMACAKVTAPLLPCNSLSGEEEEGVEEEVEEEGEEVASGSSPGIFFLPLVTVSQILKKDFVCECAASA